MSRYPGNMLRTPGFRARLYNWRAGASQPSRIAGSDFSIIYIGRYIYYTRRMHGIVGERERSNCVVDMGCI